MSHGRIFHDGPRGRPSRARASTIALLSPRPQMPSRGPEFTNAAPSALRIRLVKSTRVQHLSFAAHDAHDRKLELRRELEIALIVCRDAHDRARAVLHPAHESGSRDGNSSTDCLIEVADEPTEHPGLFEGTCLPRDRDPRSTSARGTPSTFTCCGLVSDLTSGCSGASTMYVAP